MNTKHLVPASLLLIAVAALGTWALGEGGQAFKVDGFFVEGCSCMGTCPCQFTGVVKGCQGVEGIVLKSGTYNDVDLSGAKFGVALGAGDWVRVYLEAGNPKQREAAEAFARAVYASFGKIEAVKDAKVELSGKGGRYKLLIDGGKTMELTTEPVLGKDKKPVMKTGMKDPLHPTVMQGRTLNGHYKDGDREFTLKDSNSYWNDQIKASGTI